MAVKVMVAPAIARGELARREGPEPSGRRGQAPAKPRRRRSSVYDADGNEVFITLLCLKCRKMRPLSQFGLRRMGDGAIRNQPWCRTCRFAASPGRPRRRGEPAAAVDPSAAAGAPPAAPGPADASRLASQVAAALAAGMAGRPGFTGRD